jgi:hypothetical protein
MTVPRTLAALLVVLGCATGLPAIELTLTPRTMQEALSIANSSIDRTRTRFHADYRFAVGRAPVDFIEIVPPFRRLVIAAETSARLGRRLFGQRDALDALKPDPERVELYVEFTFHPLNTFVGVPGYSVTLKPAAPGSPPILASGIDRIPRFGARVEGQPVHTPLPYPIPPRVPSGSEPLTGGTVIARFDGRRLDPNGAYDVLVADERDTPLATVRIALSRLR